jgi:AAA+ ATPase superfamily predicted ATPase
MKIIGRTREKKLLEEYRRSKVPEFVAVYGRRRVGKTFLINEFYGEDFAFSVTALSNEGKAAQLRNFHAALQKYGDAGPAPQNWYDAFERLIALLERVRRPGKKIVFFDELPWFDTRKAGFVSALEHFWNGWAASRPDILLIACGSATSWMIRKLIRNTGGLHNRVTRRMRISPFTLGETEKFLLYKDILWERHEIALAYMVFGGIPFYLNQFERGLSLAQNVDLLCFSQDAPMRDEFDILFRSLFKDSEKHLRILTALAAPRGGRTRYEILKRAGLPTGGRASIAMEELEQSGFIGAFTGYSGGSGRHVYRLSDHYTSFYLKFIKGNKHIDPGYWSKITGTGAWNNWVGHAFESVSLSHIEQIKAALSIGGVIASPFAWQSEGKNGGAQIDLLIDRNDGIINVCECKFAGSAFVIDKKYAEELRSKLEVFKRVTKTRKALHLTMITTYGVADNKYMGMVQSETTLDDLFAG